MDATKWKNERMVSETLEVSCLSLIAMGDTLACAHVQVFRECFHLLHRSLLTQALLCGLCIMTPEDPWSFAVSKLHSLKDERHPNIEW